MTKPLTPDEEARKRAYVEAACREVGCVEGGMFDLAARLLATLDAERADTDRLREAAKAYIDWRDRRLAQWEAVADHDHEHGLTPCPEWDAIVNEPFDIDQQLDDAIRAALAESESKPDTARLRALDTPAVRSAIDFIEESVAPRRCDNEAVADCVRCNSVALARWVRAALATPEPKP